MEKNKRKRTKKEIKAVRALYKYYSYNVDIVKIKETKESKQFLVQWADTEKGKWLRYYINGDFANLMGETTDNE